jgi:hypothetical protein
VIELNPRPYIIMYQWTRLSTLITLSSIVPRNLTANNTNHANNTNKCMDFEWKVHPVREVRRYFLLCLYRVLCAIVADR